MAEEKDASESKTALDIEGGLQGAWRGPPWSCAYTSHETTALGRAVSHAKRAIHAPRARIQGRHRLTPSGDQQLRAPTDTIRFAIATMKGQTIEEAGEPGTA